MLVLIEDKQNKNKCLKETESITCDDVVRDVMQCLLGCGYQRESILNAFDIVLEENGYYDTERE